jgi:hypothetical protein
MGLAGGAGAVVGGAGGVVTAVCVGAGWLGWAGGVVTAVCVGAGWLGWATAGLDAAECAATAVPQPVASAASSAAPATDRMSVTDMIVSFVGLWFRDLLSGGRRAYTSGTAHCPARFGLLAAYSLRIS